MVGLALAACADGTGPVGSEGVGVLFSVQVPAAVSTAETTALQNAFDQVDSYVVTVRDSLTDVMVSTDTVPVAAGSDRHSLRLDLPESSIGLRVSVAAVGYDGARELYRASGVATVENGVGPILPTVLSIRYTGPGIRGTVTNDDGQGLGGVGVGLYQGANIVTSVNTEPDGTYLFLGVVAGLYSVEPTPPGNLSMCPPTRTVDVQSNAAIVADFVASSTPCQIDVLVLGGGDFDETQVVADMFANTPGVNTDTFFFVSQTPGLTALRRYDVVLLFANGIFDDATTLGDELGQYVQAGGNLVLGSFYWQGRSDSGLGSAGWGALETIDPFTSDIDPLSGAGGATYSADSLAVNSVVAHPLTLGVNAVTSLAGFSGGVLAKPSATVVASWTGSGPMVGYRVLSGGQRIVAVSLFPAAEVGTEVIGDVQVLWENAVTWAGIAGGPTP